MFERLLRFVFVKNTIDVEEGMSEVLSDTDNSIEENVLKKYLLDLAKKEKSDRKSVDFQHLLELLNSGVDVNSVDKFGKTIMHEVAGGWGTDAANFLLLHGAAINQPDNFGRTPLHVASAANCSEMVSFLIENGADIHSRTLYEEQTPIHYAAKKDSVCALKTLLEKGADIESKDYKQRSPLQLAAELDRSATAKFLVESGADARVYDNSKMAVLVLLILKMPNVAILALDQFHRVDRVKRRQYFYLTYLVPPIKDNTYFVMSVLEAVLKTQHYRILLHPVMKKLVSVKWKILARGSAFKNLVIHILDCVIWTVLMCTMPANHDLMYANTRRYWGPIFEGLALIILVKEIYLEIDNFFKFRTNINMYKRWREREIRKDLQNCHDDWPDEKSYIEREIQELQDDKSVYAKDYWNYFDWICYILMGLTLILHFSSIHSHSENKKLRAIASIMMIFIWLRLLKYARPFKALGLFVVMIGHVIGDTLKILFLAVHIFIPYAASFWISFGIYGIDGYGWENLELIYNLFQMSSGGDYKFENLADYDKNLAEILCGTYVFLGGLICLNLYIALMSNTFQRLYDNAKANALMQCTAYLVETETRMSFQKQHQHREWMNKNCNPKSNFYDDDESDAENTEFMKNIEEINKKLDKINEGNEIKPLFIVLNELKFEYQQLRKQTSAEYNNLKKLMSVSIEPIGTKNKIKKKGISNRAAKNEDFNLTSATSNESNTLSNKKRLNENWMPGFVN